MRRAELPLAVVLLAALACLPLFASNLVLNFAVGALTLAMAAQGWNLLAGFGGQYSFGHAAFFGMAAYADAVLQSRWGVNAWAAAGAGVLAGGALGLVVGAAAFRARLRGSYFALITLAVAEVLRVLANAVPFTGGAAGLLLRLDPRPENFQFASRGAFYAVALLLVAGTLFGVAALARSRFGAYLVAIRENEEAARALGVDALRVKVLALALSGAITGAAGVLYTQYFLYLDADIAFGPRVSIEALLASIVGGIGTAVGPVVGALAIGALGELTRSVAGALTGGQGAGLDLLLLGLLLVAAIAFAPSGLAGVLRRGRA